MVTEKIILLVEDNQADEELTLCALEQNNILNRVVVVRDGLEALNFLQGSGAHASRDRSQLPAGYSLGANSSIRNPVSFEKFSEAVRHLGLYWLLISEAPPVR